MTLHISSPEFTEGGDIPSQFTCDGEDKAPPLHWDGIPAGARSLALIVDDPDARNTWVHWVVYNLPPTLDGLPGGIKGGALPHSAQVGVNDWHRADWGGPCPPKGRHRYFFKLYALDTLLPDMGLASKEALLQAMRGHVLAEASLMGGYRH
jgi:hypothetical protein